MKPDIRGILTDLKAAARIGHPDSVYMALDALMDAPQVAANGQLDEVFVEHVTVPLGQVLAVQTVQKQTLIPIATSPYTAMRAIAAVALAGKYLADQKVGLKDLKPLGQDARLEVRQALALALQAAQPDQPDRLLFLIQDWLSASSPRQQAVAVMVLPALADGDQALSFLADLPHPKDPDLRAAVVATLTDLAQMGHEAAILNLLETWAAAQDNYSWIIGKTLSRSWAAQSASHAALRIIETNAQTHGSDKQLKNALQALARHGAQDQVQTAIATWRQHDIQHLRALAEKLD